MDLGFRPSIIGCLLCLLAASACGDAKSDADRDSTLVLAASGDLDGDVLYGTARSLLFLTLLRVGDDGEAAGSLARSWTQSPDGHDWTFHLRADARWHDGVPVTARDLVFTYDLLSDPDVAETFAYGFVTAVDDTTLVVKAKRALTPEFWMWEIALPEHVLRDYDRKRFRSWDFWKAPVGNGPYRFARSLPATMMEFEANEDHLDGRPAIDRVLVRFVGGAGFAELLAGKIDVLSSVTATQALRIEEDPRLTLYHAFNPRLAHAVLWRVDHSFFADARVRRALTVGIDRSMLLRTLRLPEPTPVPDALYTAGQFRRGELPPPLPYDPAEAQRLLRQAGWGDADGDGVLDRDAQPFRFTLTLEPGMQEAAVVLKDQYRRVGIVVDLQQLPYRVWETRMQQGEFDAHLGYVHMTPGAIGNYFGGHETHRYSGYRSAPLIALARAAAVSTDPAARDSLYREMTDIYRADLPATPLFVFASMSAAHRRVQGLSSPFRTWAPDLVTELWLDTGAAVDPRAPTRIRSLP
jgi:peptide/nickel transport system substrate-binding protein